MAALLHRQWRWALGLAAGAAACIAVLAAAYVAATEAQELGIFRPEAELRRSSVPSPSGDATAILAYESHDMDTMRAVLAFRRGLPRSRNLIGVRGNPGVVFAWTGDRSLTVGFPAGRERPRGGLANVGEVQVTYVSYAPDPGDVVPARTYRGELRDISYAFEEIDDARHRQTQCVIRLVGSDGAIFERVGVDVMGMGFGSPDDKYKSFGTVHLRFNFLSFGDGRAPAPTPTQAKLAAVFPRNVANTPPVQDGNSITYAALAAAEAENVFSLLCGGSFEIAGILGFDQVGLTYTVRQPVGPDLLRQFNACSAKTNIGTPFSVPVD